MRLWKSIVMICLAVLIVGCNYQVVPITPVVPEPEKSRFMGDYPTLEMRKIWAYCFQSTAARNPYFPQHTVGLMCDCYVDELRETHKQSDLAKLSEAENQEMAKQLILQCNPKNPGASANTGWF